MAADNNLESAALSDFNEMEAASLFASGISVVVLLDRSASYDESDGDWSDTRLYEIQQDPLGNNGSFVSKRLTSVELGLWEDSNTELNMSSPATMTRFLQFLQNEYTAPAYELIIWGHGTGYKSTAAGTGESPSKAVAVDTYGGAASYLSLKQLGKAIEEGFGEQKAAAIGFDTCFGSLLEIQYELRNVTSYVIGSQSIIPSNGWNYTTLLNKFSQQSELNGQNFGRVCVESFKNQYSQETGIAIASIKTSEIEAMADSFNELAGFASDAIAFDSTVTSLRKALVQTKGFYSASYPSELYLDLKCLVNTLQEVLCPEPWLDELIPGVLQQIDACVDAKWASDSDCSGTGIFFCRLAAAGVPYTTIPEDYVRLSAAENKNSFVEFADRYAGSVNHSALSFLDKLFGAAL